VFGAFSHSLLVPWCVRELLVVIYSCIGAERSSMEQIVSYWMVTRRKHLLCRSARLLNENRSLDVPLFIRSLVIRA